MSIWALTLLLGNMAPPERLVLDVPTVGSVRATVREVAGDEGGPARLVFRGPAGESLGDFTFDVGRGSHTHLDVRRIDLPDLPDPLVIGVAHMLGADGVRIQVSLFGLQGQRIRALLPLVINLEAEDGICVGSLGPGQPIGVAAIRSVAGDECFVCWPKRCEALLFRWTGATFGYLETRKTTRRYKSWDLAAAEVGLVCKDEVGPTVFGKDS
jgi:hypothetical protein